MNIQAEYNELRLIAHSKMVNDYFRFSDKKKRENIFAVFDKYEQHRDKQKTIKSKIGIVNKYIKFLQDE